jgi:hypothetical protein
MPHNPKVMISNPNRTWTTIPEARERMACSMAADIISAV